MTWAGAFIWFIFGALAGAGFMMWVQSARKYHEGLTQDVVAKNVVASLVADWEKRKRNDT